MNSFEFIVYGNPQGKARPRFNFKTKTAYNTKQTTSYEEQIKQSFVNTYPNTEPYIKPIKMLIYAIMPIPKSYSKIKAKNCEENIIKPTVKPDGDNIAKVVQDALNGIAYSDDKQITKLTVYKRYGTVPRLEIRITEDKE